MVGEMTSSASPKSQVHQRTSSTNSTGKTSTGQRGKTGKAHAVGKHNRNTSVGRNLNKLGMVSVEKPAKPQRSKSQNTPSTSPSSANVRRNKSEVALPRTASKVQIKKNQSAVALRRNESAGRLKRLSRPPTPRKENEDDPHLKGHAQPAFGFGSEDEEEDDDNWTEESASQSPVVTRNGSPKVSRPTMLVDNRRKSSTDAQTVHAESPKTPVASISKPVLLSHPADPLDPTDITKRLLNRSSSSQLAPKLSTISAGGSSGTQSPARPEPSSKPLAQPTEQISVPPSQLRANSQPPIISVAGTPQDPSLGADGVSHFLDPQAAASSSGRNATQLHNAMGMLRLQRDRSPSPSPATASAPTGEGVRRAKSAVQLSRTGSSAGNVRARSQQRGQKDQRDRSGADSRQGSLDDREWTMTIDPHAIRRTGGNTQAKMELWRSEQAAETELPGRPPVPLIQRMNVAAASSYLGVEERRVRMAEEAESELSFLRIFRNPAIESTERVRKERKRRERERTRSMNGHERKNLKGQDTIASRQLQPKARSADKSRPGTANGSIVIANETAPNGTKSSSVGSGGSTVNGEFESHTPGRRSVRFDVGADGHLQEDLSENGDGENKLTSLLRSLWEGVETEIVD